MSPALGDEPFASENFFGWMDWLHAFQSVHTALPCFCPQELFCVHVPEYFRARTGDPWSQVAGVGASDSFGQLQNGGRGFGSCSQPEVCLNCVAGSFSQG